VHGAVAQVSSTSSIIERALEETIAQLTREQASPKVRAILIEARRLRSMVASWKAIPPPPPARKELYATAMQLFAKVGVATPPVPSLTPAPRHAIGAASPGTPRPLVNHPAKHLASLDDPLAAQVSEPLSEPPSPMRGGRPQSEIETLPPKAGRRTTLAPGITLYRPAGMEWRPLPGAVGVSVKVLQRDERSGTFRALVRMAPGTELPRHRHAGTEEVLVVEGGVTMGDFEVQPGEYCFSEPDSVHEAIRSPRGCTLFLIGSEHDELLPPD
jgi:quercetin dioxygenase-like cupin family protein